MAISSFMGNLPDDELLASGWTIRSSHVEPLLPGVRVRVGDGVNGVPEQVQLYKPCGYHLGVPIRSLSLV